MNEKTENQEVNKTEQLLPFLKEEVKTAAGEAAHDLGHNVIGNLRKKADELGLEMTEADWLDFVKYVAKLNAEELGLKDGSFDEQYFDQGCIKTDVLNGVKLSEILPSYAEEKNLPFDTKIKWVDINKILEDKQEK